MATKFITFEVSAYQGATEPDVTLFIQGPKGGTQHICRMTKAQAQRLRNELNAALAE